MAWRIKSVAERTGIPKETLIAWERRYGFVQPERTASGYRMYSDADVAVLQRVQGLIEQGLKISEAVSRLREEAPSRPVDAGRLRASMLTALLRLDSAAAERLGSAAMLPIESAVNEVWLPILREVGTLWERGEATVAQEHFVTAVCRERMLAMLATLRRADERGPELFFATPPGEQHEVGLLGIAVRLSLRGYRVVYFGADVPVDSVARHAGERKPLAVCWSWVLLTKADRIRKAARDLRRRLPDETGLVVGGPAVEAVTLDDEVGIVYVTGELPDFLQPGAAAPPWV